jgi:hypothetical protein
VCVLHRLWQAGSASLFCAEEHNMPYVTAAIPPHNTTRGSVATKTSTTGSITVDTHMATNFTNCVCH